MREALSPDQAALYEIIWRRFIGSQMKPALYSVTTVDVLVTGKSGQFCSLFGPGRRKGCFIYDEGNKIITNSKKPFKVIC